MSNRPTRRISIAALAVTVASISALAGCSAGPLSTTCEEFMQKSLSEQEEIITEWNKEGGMPDDLAELGGSTEVGTFQTYCADPANSDDEIGDLEFTF